MRIGIDARVFEKGMTGVGRYLYNILAELPKYDNQNEYFIFSSKKLDLDSNFYKTVITKKSIIPHKLYSPYWLNRILPKLLSEYKIDILFSPNMLIPLVNTGKVRTVAVVHDLIVLIYKKYYPFFFRKYMEILLPLSARKTSRIITVSEQSKIDIIKYLFVSERSISIAYNVAAPEFKPRNISEYENIPEYKSLYLPPKYILYVGMIEKRKNIAGLVRIIDAVREKGSSLKLVLVGKPGYGSNNILPEIYKRNDYIFYYDSINDALLKYIYNSAFTFVFPSYYEGFGIPPLEAMQSGIPVISSNASSLKEVVGNGGKLFDPDDYEGFAETILKLENNGEYYEEMKKSALKQSEKFNIANTIDAVLKTFNTLK